MSAHAVAEQRLRDAEWRARADTQAIFAALGGAEGRTRAVGGVVRDTVLGRADADIDMATELVPQEVVRQAEAAGIACYPTGIEHGTVTLRLGDTVVEVTTLRRDVETDGRHAVVAFGSDWAEDAARRDFSLNALFACSDGRLFDPLGGLEDALAGRVRFIGEPAQRIAEDGLRVFRFFRFSAAYADQKLDAAALAACADAAGRLEHLSAERVGAEMLRMLALPRVAQTLRVMAQIGLLPIAEPQLQALAGYEERGGAAVSARLALLMGEGNARELQQAWRLSNELIRQAMLVREAARLMAQNQIDEALYRWRAGCREGVLVAAVLAGWSPQQTAEIGQLVEQKVVPPLPISGADLVALGMKPGPTLGKELGRLEAMWIASGFRLDREALLGAAKL
ncbi:MAG: tRNA nucleotidyltransferase [Devosia sp.]|nr:tRNA nucleotidyltransferase [Devosia sp.]